MLCEYLCGSFVFSYLCCINSSWCTIALLPKSCFVFPSCFSKLLLYPQRSCNQLPNTYNQLFCGRAVFTYVAFVKKWVLNTFSDFPIMCVAVLIGTCVFIPLEGVGGDTSFSFLFRYLLAGQCLYIIFRRGLLGSVYGIHIFCVGGSMGLYHASFFNVIILCSDVYYIFQENIVYIYIYIFCSHGFLFCECHEHVHTPPMT